MTYSRIASITAALALAAGLLAGCAAPAPEEGIVAVTPPAVAVTPAPAAAAAGAQQSFHGTLGMTPLEAHQAGVIRLQSFAGDVCVADASGNGSVSHCVCEQTNCNCRATTATCTP